MEAGNHDKVLTSELYHAKQSVEKGISSVRIKQIVAMKK